MLFRLESSTVVDGESVLPLARVKEHLEVDSDYRDPLIEIFRDAAIDLVQQYTMRRLALNDVADPVLWRGNGFGSAPRGILRLGVGPVHSVLAINYRDSQGAAAVMPLTDVVHSGGSEIEPAAGKNWPDVDGGLDCAVISLRVGYEAGKVPGALISAMLLMIGHLYANRESVVIGTMTAELPLGFEALCDKYRDPVI